ncbi:MAG: glycosidase [Armatimonadota bacterium]|nr:glycosidase [Armatimonadota bacterium]
MELERYACNPVLEPTSYWWERRAVFNGGAVYENGRVHLLYRAVGDDYISRFGYASSEDGITFDMRSAQPVMESEDNNGFERLGCEDPRVTRLDGKFYVAYTAASVYPASQPLPDGCTGAPWRVRVALASTEDFKTFQRHGVVIPDVDSKNAALFPEKVGGKYALLHRVFPNLWVCQSDDLLHWERHHVVIGPRKGYWDAAKVGAGAPPMRTELGWLEIYHGVSEKGVYGLGALLMDLEDPTRILYRSERPILTPDLEFERNGFVPNVVFTCGAVEKDGRYLVYYGGADKAIGVASIERDTMLRELSE